MISFNFRRTIAVFMLIIFVTSAVSPTISYALTSGPTAPEATSFEPVDTTDMVDLKSGDLTYNLPLLEIPGPAGSYPLSLSYHAGIQPDQEASWVGLGWTLNPGSISRLVNGYPDDHDNVTNVSRSFWEGGETERWTVGVSVGIAYCATVSAGLQFAQDTYRGSGVGGYIGATLAAGLSENAGVGLNVTMGISPYGDHYASAGLNLGVSQGGAKALKASGSIGVSINSGGKVDAGATGGISATNGKKGREARSASLLGASINTSGSAPSLSVAGISGDAHNSKGNLVSTASSGFVAEIPVYIGVNLRIGRDYTRYWIDESEQAHSFGSLYYNNVDPNYHSAFDVFDILDPSLDLGLHDNTDKVLGGSFPDVDHYTVTAQGIGGQIAPFHFQQDLYSQDKRDASEDNEVLVKNYKLNEGRDEGKIHFRFLNDFSNRYEYDPGDFHINGNQISFNWEGAPVTGKEGNDGINGNHLAGSKHVAHYTNQEILGTRNTLDPFSEGFIDCTAEGFIRSSDTQIGGFSITSASGVTYHYALPAYSFDEFMKSENVAKQEDGLNFNAVTKPERYAYTWYLTSVTGPDFMDRNENGHADHGDWGYWVDFHYKKTYDNYRWRNPGYGTNLDVDGEFGFYSSGKKEIYYLDKIVTETHIALFEKSLRIDGREVYDDPNGGFMEVPEQMEDRCELGCMVNYCDNIDGGTGCANEQEFRSCRDECQEEYKAAVRLLRPLMKLDRIKLYRYEDYSSHRTGDEYLLRLIQFNYDYYLATGTLNSYDQETLLKSGKLTLEKIFFKGKKGKSLVPPFTFEYNNEPYERDKTDIWGFYKSDFSTTFRDATNDVIGRLPTEASAQNVDAWSLKTVHTPLGASIEIEYESDRYTDVVLASEMGFRTKDVLSDGQDRLKIKFWEAAESFSNFLSENEYADLAIVGAYTLDVPIDDISCNCGVFNKFKKEPFITKFTGKVKIEEINQAEGYVIVSGSEIYNKILETKKYEVKASAPLKTPVKCDPNKKKVCELTYKGVQAWPDYFPAGILSVTEKTRPGGGLRVKAVTFTNASGIANQTLYEYENGTTSYEPYKILPPKIHPDYVESGNDQKKVRIEVKKLAYKDVYKQLALSRHIPGPGVMYQFVNVKEKVIHPSGEIVDLPNYTRYEFKLYEKGMVDVLPGNVIHADISDTYDDVSFNKALLNKVTLKDFSSRVGSLKTTTLFKTEGNVPVSSTINHYLHDDLDGSFEGNVNDYETLLADKFLNQGVTEQTYSRARISLFKSDEHIPYPEAGETRLTFESHERNLIGVITKYEKFPSVLTGQSTTNFKTGIKSESKTLAFDYYSGEPVKQVSTDSYGNRYLSVTVPAYKNYRAMGSKVTDKQNKNMLSQVGETYSFTCDERNLPTGLLSASVQTWSDRVKVLNVPEGQRGIWRMDATYFWKGDESNEEDFVKPNGAYDYQEFLKHPYSYLANAANPLWEKTNRLTLYDVYSHGLEATDINGNFVSTRMSPDQLVVTSSAVNASYAQAICSGAEYYSSATNDEDVKRGNGNPSSVRAHTGSYSLLVGSGGTGFNYTLPSESIKADRPLRASVWVYVPGESEQQSELNKIQLYYMVNGVELGSVFPVLQNNKSKSWYQLNLNIPARGEGDLFIGVRNNATRGVYFDDFRIHPSDASMTAFVYDQFSGELTHILDANNFYTKFEYDEIGRLLRTSKELLNYDFGNDKKSIRPDAVLQTLNYNYGKNQE